MPPPERMQSRALRSTTPQQHHALAFRYGEDPCVQCLSYTALALRHLGYPDQALHRSHEAITLAQELAHPFTLAWALDFAVQLHHLRREPQAVQERAEALIALSQEQGFAMRLAQAQVFPG